MPLHSPRPPFPRPGFLPPTHKKAAVPETDKLSHTIFLRQIFVVLHVLLKWLVLLRLGGTEVEKNRFCFVVCLLDGWSCW